MPGALIAEQSTRMIFFERGQMLWSLAALRTAIPLLYNQPATLSRYLLFGRFFASRQGLSLIIEIEPFAAMHAVVAAIGSLPIAWFLPFLLELRVGEQERW